MIIIEILMITDFNLLFDKKPNKITDENRNTHDKFKYNPPMNH